MKEREFGSNPKQKVKSMKTEKRDRKLATRKKEVLAKSIIIKQVLWWKKDKKKMLQNAMIKSEELAKRKRNEKKIC